MTAIESSVKSIEHRVAVASHALRTVISEYDLVKGELEAMRSAKAAEFRDWQGKIERLKSFAAKLETQVAAMRHHAGAPHDK